MKSQERLLAAIQLKEPDHVPCAPFLSPQVVAQMSSTEWQRMLKETDVTMSVSILGDLAVFGGQYYIDHVSTVREGNVSITRIETPEGPLEMRQVQTPEATWTAEYMGKDERDVKRLFSIPYEPPSFDTKVYDGWRERVGNEGLVALGICSPFRLCLGFFGSEGLYLRLADEPGAIERLVAIMCERTEVYVRAACEKGIRHFWMGGSEHCGPGVVSPRYFRRMVTPFDKRIVDIIHEYGGTVNQHMHGKMRAVLDEIVEIGCDVISPIETGLRGDVTLAEVKARIGDRICLKGNLDDMAFIAQASPEEISEAAEDAIAQAAEGGGYMLSGTDAGVYHPRWVHNFLVMARVARAHPY